MTDTNLNEAFADDDTLTRRASAYANGACSHCLGSKISKNGIDECPWCDGFGTASMEAKILDATGRTPPKESSAGHHGGRR